MLEMGARSACFARRGAESTQFCTQSNVGGAAQSRPPDHSHAVRDCVAALFRGCRRHHAMQSAVSVCFRAFCLVVDCAGCTHPNARVTRRAKFKNGPLNLDVLCKFQFLQLQYSYYRRAPSSSPHFRCRHHYETPLPNRHPPAFVHTPNETTPGTFTFSPRIIVPFHSLA